MPGSHDTKGPECSIPSVLLQIKLSGMEPFLMTWGMWDNHTQPVLQFILMGAAFDLGCQPLRLHLHLCPMDI